MEIPSYSDPEGHAPVAFSITPQPSPFLSVNGGNFEIYCSDQAKVGTTIQYTLTLADPYGATSSYTLNLFIRNDAPSFIGGSSPSNIQMKVMEELVVPLPAIMDD